jgi:hypothetical protein
MITLDELFLRTIESLKNRSKTSDEFELMMAAGLLRKLLLDANPLVDQVNRSRRLKLRFRIAMRGPGPLGQPSTPTLWALPSGLDPTSLDPGTSTAVQEVDKSVFLRRPVSLYKGEVATVHDLIDYFAHVRGAVHYGSPSTAKERALHELETYNWTDGLPIILEVLRSVIRVVVNAMDPLTQAVKNE